MTLNLYLGHSLYHNMSKNGNPFTIFFSRFHKTKNRAQIKESETKFTANGLQLQVYQAL